MSVSVRFPFNADKFPHVVAYLLSRVGPCSRLKLAKLLYLADRIHVVRHGRPIVGGRYYALNQGPVPSLALDILEDLEEERLENQPRQVPAGFVLKLDALIEVDVQPKYAEYKAKGKPDLDQLSKSDLHTLDEVIRKFGDWTAWRLREYSHQHEAYKKTPVPNEIDYLLFFEDEEGARKEVSEYLAATQEDRDVLDHLVG